MGLDVEIGYTRNYFIVSFGAIVQNLFLLIFSVFGVSFAMDLKLYGYHKK